MQQRSLLEQVIKFTSNPAFSRNAYQLVGVLLSRKAPAFWRFWVRKQIFDLLSDFPPDLADRVREELRGIGMNI
jgi:hypothetical protein